MIWQLNISCMQLRKNSQIKKSIIPFISTSANILCLSVCLFVSNKRRKRLNQSGPIFLWDLMWPQGRFMMIEFEKNLPLTKFDFRKFTKCFFYKIREILVLFLFYNVCKEKMLTIEIEDKRKAPWKQSKIKTSSISTNVLIIFPQVHWFA